MVALALPLAPLAPGAAAAAGTFVIGSAAYIAQQVHGFRAPLPAPMIPRTGGKAGGATMQEMVADAIAGARIPVALPPNPLGPRGSIGLVGLLAGLSLLRRFGSQLWGYLTSRPKAEPPPGGLAGVELSGLVGANGGEVWITLTAKQRYHSCNISPGMKCYGDVLDANVGTNFRKSYGPGGGGLTVQTTPGDACGLDVATVTAAGGTGINDTSASVIGGTGSYCGDLVQWSAKIEYRNPIGATKAPSFPLKPEITQPNGFKQPQVTPKTAPARVVPPVEPTPMVPTRQPEPEQSPVPVEPGPNRVPVFVPVRVPATAPKTPPVPARVIVVRPDGTLPAPAKDPVAVTHPDAHYPIPGGGPITGNGPQAKPEEIAKELGRLEQKLNGILNPTPDTPVEWQNLLRQLWDMFQNLKDAKTYTITEKCPPCDPDQDYDPPKVEVTAPGATDALGVIANRIDALAVLLDGQLGLKQKICPPCKPTIRGELVTINFQSDPAEVPSRYAIKKHLSYRDQSGRDEEFHIQHWQGFSWDTGAAIVTSKGLSWGIVKVWAVDNAEGQRVIAHAATAAGVNLNDPKHEWVFSTTDHPRYGRQGTVWPVKWDETGKLMISKRGGPSGLPGYKRNS